MTTYFCLRNYFISTGVFVIVKGNDNLFEICDTYKGYFENEKSMSLEELERVLENEKKQGAFAEEFVLNFERKRLNDLSDNIKIISNTNILAGYDIISYHSKDNKNRIYIEVKSYSRNKIL